MYNIPNKITIAVVTYHEDFKLLQRLLDSIFLFWKKDQIDCIKVIYHDKLIYKKEFMKIIKQYLKKEIPIEIYYANDLCPSIQRYDWCSQQYYKLIISKYIKQDWYIIHDCKDYYIDHVCIEDIFSEDGKATMQLNFLRYSNFKSTSNQVSPSSIWTPGPFMFAFEQTCEMFEVDFTNYMSWHLPTTTPFIAKTEIVKELVSKMSKKLGTLFPKLFVLHYDGQFVATEFLLYNAYVTSKNLLNILYCDWNTNHRKYFNKIKQSKDLRITGNLNRD
jgi:hypothetical protein